MSESTNQLPPVAPPDGLDDADFFAAVAESDHMGVVVRGAIYIEHELIALVEENLKSPQALKGINLGYRGSVALAIAVGLDQRFQEPLLALGKQRNKFAHDPGVTISDTEANTLFNALNNADRAVVSKTLSSLAAAYPDKFAGEKLDPMDRVRLVIVALRQAARAARMFAQLERRLIETTMTEAGHTR